MCEGALQNMNSRRLCLQVSWLHEYRWNTLKSGSSLFLLFKLSKCYPSWFCSLVFFALGVCGLCACVCFVSFLGQFSGLTSAVRGFGRIAQSCKHLTLTRFKMRLANLCKNKVLLTYVLILWKMRLVNEFDEENREPDQHQEHWACWWVPVCLLL